MKTAQTEQEEVAGLAGQNSDSMIEDIIAGFIASRQDSPGTYAPRLISNQPGSTMGEAISQELAQSQSFDISVAFVSSEAIKTLFQDFIDHASDHSTHSGRIITSTKGYFNTPHAFKDLLRLKDTAGVDVRIWNDPVEHTNSRPGQGQLFHPKGYLFSRTMVDGKPYYNLYVGSSNLTQQALEFQREWNLRVSSLEDGQLLAQVKEEVESQVDQSEPLTDDWIKQYEADFERYAPPRRESIAEAKSEIIEPNNMQREALANLAELRDKGDRKAIIISATGTGKTILSALDVKAVQPKRMLYVAQQEQILKSAKDSYQNVLGCASKDLGFLTGKSKSTECKYTFATVQTLSQDKYLDEASPDYLPPDEFDYILIDEAHHSGADSYQKIIKHFTEANFMLGMTATPERTDGFNIFNSFGNNIAYEIRLQQALDENMLCPFHYYGIAEYLGQEDDKGAGQGRIDARSGLSTADSQQLDYEISQLSSPERVDYIIEKLRQYTSSYEQVTGLVFCSRIHEAKNLSALFNERFNQQAERNYKTVCLTAETPTKQKDKALADLQNGELDYIFTVDLYNEGVDIPALNQIVMLRPTQSSIIFTQQLGRGLRKFPHKESVTILDFIGNYQNNFLIPIALYGKAGDRDTARKNLQKRSIGLSSISFDEISRERVLRSLDKADWTEMKKLREAYRLLRFELGRIPLLGDVYRHDPSLPQTLASKRGDYLTFVRSCESSLRSKKVTANQHSADGLQPTNDIENGILKMATEILLPGLRPHELVILEQLCNTSGILAELSKGGSSIAWKPAKTLTIAAVADAIQERFPAAEVESSYIESAIRVLDYSYFTGTNSQRFGHTPLIHLASDGTVTLTPVFTSLLAGNQTFRTFFADTIETGLANCRDLFAEAASCQRKLEHGFLYERKYTLADVERLLCWPKEINGQNVGGYFLQKDNNTMPIFIKYESSQYEDSFLNPQELLWYSKNGRTTNSPEFTWMTQDLGSESWEDQHFVPVFIMRREETQEKRYYYVGHVRSIDNPETIQQKAPASSKPLNVTTTILHLAKSLTNDLYRHLTGNSAY